MARKSLHFDVVQGMVFVIHKGDSDAAPRLGTIDTTDVYSAAVEASKRFFKVHELPKRQTGWAGTSGAFATRPMNGISDHFFVKVPP